MLPVVAVYLRWTLGLGPLFLENRVWERGSCSRGSCIELATVAGAGVSLGGLIIIIFLVPLDLLVFPISLACISFSQVRRPVLLSMSMSSAAGEAASALVRS